MASPFFEIRFPVRVARGASVKVRSKTQVSTTGGGQERRGRRWSNPLREWDAARGIRGEADLEEVRAFQIVMGGRHAGFRFHDFSDYKAVRQLIDTSGDGPFQLRKGYTAGSVTKWRPLTKPVPRTTWLELNGEIAVCLDDGMTIEEWSALWGEVPFGFNPDTAPRFSLDTTTGLLTPVGFTVTGADVLIASLEFDVPARFGSDEFEVRAHSRGKNWEYMGLPVRELRS
jgi:hypothetical protein